MENVYIKNPKCELEPQWFFLEGGPNNLFFK